MTRMPRLAAAAAIALGAGLATAPSGARSPLDGHPSQTRYLSNDAPFVVFGVTPTHVDGSARQVLLSFVATDRVEQVNVFPFVRAAPDAPAQMAAQVPCGPRDPGSWDCLVPVAGLLARLEGAAGQLGLRIEAHGDLTQRGRHSTVIVTLPVRRAPAGFNG
ncbi:hypothetical protein [Xenophilus azovorans]|uniref:hypothetical protein n=1 Tax=Xenophilus azovorans TaxID=151755 RepID=UPI0005703A3D|nr:hypothetical protein [Xenophilus azovorans]